MLRDGMQRLVDEIVRSRLERADFLAKNRRDTDRMLRNASRARAHETLEHQYAAAQLVSSLQDFNRSNQVRVARKIRDHRLTRQTQSSHDSMLRKQDAVRNRRSVVRMLDSAGTNRLRSARQQEAAAQQTISSVRMQVQQIRHQARRLTKTVSDDLQATRRAWARLRAEVAKK